MDHKKRRLNKKFRFQLLQEWLTNRYQPARVLDVGGGKGLPCCVIDEPLEKQPGINWLNSLIGYAKDKGFAVKRDTLNFKGQNVLIYTAKNLSPHENTNYL